MHFSTERCIVRKRLGGLEERFTVETCDSSEQACEVEADVGTSVQVVALWKSTDQRVAVATSILERRWRSLRPKTQCLSAA